MSDPTTTILEEMLELMRGGHGLSGGNYSPSSTSAPDPAVAGMSKQFATLSAAIKRAEAAHNDLTHDMSLHQDEVQEAIQLQSKQSDNMIALNKAFKENKISADKYRQELGRLEREVDDLGDTMGNLNDKTNKALKQQIEKGKKDAAAVKQYEELKKSISGLMTVSGSIKAAFAGLNAVGAVAGKFVSGLQNNASGMELSSGIMTAGIDAVGGAGKMAGDAIGTVGGAMAASTGKVRLLGLAASVAGPLLSGFSDSLSKLAKFGVNVLQKEVEKTIKSFNDASSAGAMFADGMTGMRNASGDAGLTVEQFSGVLKTHSSTIAASGLGVADGAKKMGAALKAGGKPMQDQLLNLGYSFEEQAGLVADTMQQMKGSSVGPMGASDAAIAEQTQKYAENLRVIAAITGEDAKKRSEAVKQQMNQLAFQQKLAEKSPEQQAAVRRAMENMSEIQRKNFMDMVNFGSVINKEGAVFNSASAGMRDLTAQSLRDFNNGVMDENTERANQAKNGEQVHKDMLANTSIATAGAAGVGGLVGSLAESMGKELQFRIAWTKQAQEAAEKGTTKQKDTPDELTAGVRNAAIAAQELAVELQKTLTPAIQSYAKVAAEILEGVRKQVADLGLGGADNQGPSFWDKLSAAGKGASKQGAIDAGIGMAGAGIVTLASGGAAAPSIPLAGLAGLIYGGVTGGIDGWMNAEKGKSVGGIASGPTEGYLEKLHGTELIIPMVGGSLNTASQGYADLMTAMNKTSRPSTSVSTSSTSNISNFSQTTSGNVELDTGVITSKLDAIIAASYKSATSIADVVAGATIDTANMAAIIDRNSNRLTAEQEIKIYGTQINAEMAALAAFQPIANQTTRVGIDSSSVLNSDNFDISTMVTKLADMITNNLPGMTGSKSNNNKTDEWTSNTKSIGDNSIAVISELRKIAISISESLEVSKQSLEFQQKLVDSASTHSRSIDVLSKTLA